jgi:ubiquinone/menaquinone biosynthesis C-methylase UbiE
MTNIDHKTVSGFGQEWEKFDQSEMPDAEREDLFDWYFRIFPWTELPEGAVGCDIGCGSGRWALLVAPRVGHLHCIDPSSAIDVAKRNLSQQPNVTCHKAGVDDLPIADSSMDFGYSLGVLHHIPDTAAALSSCVKKLKPGAPFLVYLYYAFDNRPAWFRTLWKLSDGIRKIVSQLPHGLKYAVSQVFAATLYWPLARAAKFGESIGLNVESWPLTGYRDRTFYTMRTDALDRFGTQLEHRFTRTEIEQMMRNAGLENIRFSDQLPFWCAVGKRVGV